MGPSSISNCGLLAFACIAAIACTVKSVGRPSAQQLQSSSTMNHTPEGGSASWRLEATAWQYRVLQEHPLVGKVYAARSGTLVEPSELLAALAGSRFVLLGERHDNPDHHQLQSYLVGRLLAQRHDLAVAFEMLDIERQATIDAARSSHPRNADSLAAAVDWEDSGWPEWSMYRPLFTTALQAGARIVAANLSRERARAIVRAGAAASPVPVKRLPQLPPAQADALERELADSHCGMLPGSVIAGMALAQRVRDWMMAERLSHADKGSGAVLIAGAQHVRRDRGVPIALAAMGDPHVLSVAIFEVRRDEVQPSAYWNGVGGVQPFDFVIFTPRGDERDPCEHMRETVSWDFIRQI